MLLVVVSDAKALKMRDMLGWRVLMDEPETASAEARIIEFVDISNNAMGKNGTSSTPPFGNVFGRNPIGHCLHIPARRNEAVRHLSGELSFKFFKIVISQNVSKISGANNGNEGFTANFACRGLPAIFPYEHHAFDAVIIPLERDLLAEDISANLLYAHFAGHINGVIRRPHSISSGLQSIAQEDHRPSAYPSCYDGQRSHDPLCVRVRRREQAEVRGLFDHLTVAIFGAAAVLGIGSFYLMGRWMGPVLDPSNKNDSGESKR